MPISSSYYVKIPIKKDWIDQSVILTKKYERRYFLAYLAFRQYVLGKACLQNKIVKAIFPPFSTKKQCDVYLMVNERQKTMRPTFSFSFNTRIFIKPTTIYVFCSIINNICVFYGWLTGEELNKIKEYHPKGERRTYYVGDEAKVKINNWEHYSIRIEQLKTLPKYNPQIKLTDF